MKKVLIITYYWPPCGGIGVLRCLKFAKYLRQFGWEPVIFTAEDAHYPSIDITNEKDIPEGITVLRQKIWEPYHIYKFITGQKKDANVNNVFYASEKKLGFFHNLSVWIRSNFFIPDARSLWIKPSVKFLKSYLKENRIDAIISNGPPHSNTRIATLLKKETGIPWIADFQDPWSQVDYFGMLKLTSRGRKKHLEMEQEVFKHANAITIVSNSWKRDLEDIGAKNVTVLPWGFDPDDYKEFNGTPQEHFTITHTGILGVDRQINTLINSIQAFSNENAEFGKKVKLKLVGLVDASIKKSVEQAGISSMVDYVGSVDRMMSLQYLANSTIQLLVLNNQANAEGRIPGKLFEYLASGKPIICFGPEKSDVADIIQQHKAGYYCTFDDIEGCIIALKAFYKQYSDTNLTFTQTGNIKQYSNIEITGNLSQILNDITGK